MTVVGDSTETSYVTQQNPTGQAEAGSLVTITGVETKTPEPDPGDDPALMEMTLLGYGTNSFGDWVGEMGRTYVGGTSYRLDDGITEKGGKVRLMVEATWSDSKIFKQSDSGWRDIDGQIVWTSSAMSVATVDSTGVVTAVGDGEAVITATAPNGVSATMGVTVIGQNGAYVAGAHVVDEAGDPYGTSYVVVDDINTGSRTFYVQLRYSDGTTACNAPGASDYSAEGSAVIASCCTWSITSSDVGYVNPSSGNFIPSQDGRSQVIVTATGGNPNVANGLVTASVSINVNTGKYKDGKAPSSQLAVKVEYEQMPGVVGKEETYSIDELQGIQNVTCTYSLTKSGGLYVTDTASGIYLSTLLEHMGIATSDVLYFQFAANDGANPGKITNSFLFGYERYYFPLANAASTNGQVAVAPMLAYADSWREGGTCEPNTELNSGTCLRLLFGSTGLADNSTSKSLKYINTMTIVLDGAPPTDWGNNTKPDGKDEDKRDGGTRTDDKGGNGGGSGLSSGQGSATGLGTSEGEGIGDSSGATLGSSESPDDPGDSDGFGDAEEDGTGSAARWQVFEMMSNAQSDIDPIDFSNPLEPFVLPGVAAVAAAGGGFTFRRYRKELAV